MSSTITKQGIVSILGSESDLSTTSPSIRRTFSADMSSKKWLAQNGFPSSPMKRIASSEDFSFSSYGKDEEPGQDDVWKLIQSQKKKVMDPNQDDIWASIVSQKANEDEKSTRPPPYVHPLVKRSSSALSEKSLEICTESLGSESGSDAFSSYAPSEAGDTEEDKDGTQVTHSQPLHEKEPQSFILDEPQSDKYIFSTTKRSSPKCFPPPLPSLAKKDGPSLHMQPRREEGRLLLEAVSIPFKNCFRAHRQDGRLLLTIANNTIPQELDLDKVVNQEEGKAKDVFDNLNIEDCDYVQEEDEEEEDDDEYDDDENENEDEVIRKFHMESVSKEFGFVVDHAPNYSREAISVHRSASTMKRLIGMNNRDPNLTEKLKKSINWVETNAGMEAHLDPITPLSHSLPRAPISARLIQPSQVDAVSASFNACDYFWQAIPSKESSIIPISQNNLALRKNDHNITSLKLNQNREMVHMRENKGNYLLPLVSSCKENKKSLLFWETYCIATS